MLDKPVWFLSIVAWLAAGVLCVAMPSVRNTDWFAIGAPFAWRDVLFIGIASAIPCGVIFATGLRTRLSRAQLTIVACGIASSAMVALIAVWNVPDLSSVAGMAWRTGLSLLIAAAASLFASVATSAKNTTLCTRWNLIAALLALFLAPAAYVQGRWHHDAGQLLELTEQSRYGEALRLARQWQDFAPDLALHGGSTLARAIARLETVVEDLQSKVATPLPSNNTVTERLDRARLLAMLGSVATALSALDGVGEDNPEACGLRALIHENHGEWLAARGWYSRALAAWEVTPPSDQRTAGLMEAHRGTGYCERKLGRCAAAEANYLELLQLAPTADTHFLLAQFYEDTQQSQRSAHHAHRAMDLDPQRYAADGDKLLNKLKTQHFGCLTVY